MDGDLLSVEILPLLVELGVDDWIKLQLADLREYADWRLYLLQQRVRSANPDIGLTTDDSLCRDILALQICYLNIDALFLGAFKRDEKVQRFHRRDVTKCNAHCVGMGDVWQCSRDAECGNRH